MSSTSFPKAPVPMGP
ncbi:unnamed protein product, partial [Rotaria sp. Silwood2]